MHIYKIVIFKLLLASKESYIQFNNTMSERGKYYQTPDSQKKTESLALAPTIHSSRPESLPLPSDEKKVEEIRSGVRSGIGCGAVLATCIGLAASGAIGTLGFMYAKGQSPFDSTDKKTTSGEIDESDSTIAPVESSKLDVPVVIYSNNDLKTNLNALKIKATAQDFDFETSRPELQAKAVYLVVLNGPENKSDKQLVWKPVNQRITHIDEKELLVAVKIVNPYISDKPYESIVPEGLSYRARTSDEDDPTIMYFYYNCRDKKGAENMLAQIGIKDPSRPKRLMWARSFNIPSCD